MIKFPLHFMQLIINKDKIKKYKNSYQKIK
jgi:hypothetical protein